MIIFKAREKSVNLIVMESLKVRMYLEGKSHYQYVWLEKGFIGEAAFDRLLKALAAAGLVLCDLRLRVNGKFKQLDCVVITSKAVLLYEIKNFEGAYTFKEDKKLYRVASDKPIWNPFTQLEEAETLLQQLLGQLGIQLPIQSYVVFINPKMTLYQAPNHPSLLLASNLEQHLEQVNKNTAALTGQHQALARKLSELSLPDTLYPQDIPDYTFEGLRKGVICVGCGEFVDAIAPKKGKYCHCKKCDHREPISETLNRLINEYRRLFPDSIVNTITIYQWCGEVFSMSRIRSHLQKYYSSQGNNRWTQYV